MENAGKVRAIGLRNTTRLACASPWRPASAWAAALRHAAAGIQPLRPRRLRARRAAAASDIEGRPRAAGLKKHFEGDRGSRILAALDPVSQRLGATPAQVSLAWIMAQPSIAAPIVSATSVGQLDEIATAAGLNLRAEDLAELDRASRQAHLFQRGDSLVRPVEKLGPRAAFRGRLGVQHRFGFGAEHERVFPQ